VPDDWRKVNVTPALWTGKEEDPGSYRVVSLSSICGKVMEQIILETIFRHTEDKKLTGSSWHGFTKGK